MASKHIQTTKNSANYRYSRNDYTPDKVNVGQIERWVSALGGGILALYGIGRLDLTGLTLATLGGGLVYRGVTGHSFLYQAIGMSTAEQTPTVTASSDKGLHIRRAMTVRRSPADLYSFWRDVEKSPRYMTHVESVLKTGDRTSHWIAKSPLGNKIEWNSEIVQDEPGRLIAWRVQGNPMAANAGKVQFEPAPDGRGTVVTLELDYQLVPGPLGASIGQVLGHIPEREVLEDLRHFKELMEAGEIPTVKGQPTGEGRK